MAAAAIGRNFVDQTFKLCLPIYCPPWINNSDRRMRVLQAFDMGRSLSCCQRALPARHAVQARHGQPPGAGPDGHTRPGGFVPLRNSVQARVGTRRHRFCMPPINAAASGKNHEGRMTGISMREIDIGTDHDQDGRKYRALAGNGP